MLRGIPRGEPPHRQAHVPPAGLGPALADAGVLLEVCLAAFPESAVTQALVLHPLATLDVELDAVQVAGCVGVRSERCRCRLALSARRGEACLEAAGREPANVAESATGHQATLPERQVMTTGSTVPSRTNSSRAETGIRTCRPTRTNLIRRSAMSRRGNRSEVPKTSPTSSTLNNLSMPFIPCRHAAGWAVWWVVAE